MRPGPGARRSPWWPSAATARQPWSPWRAVPDSSNSTSSRGAAGTGTNCNCLTPAESCWRTGLGYRARRRTSAPARERWPLLVHHASVLRDHLDGDAVALLKDHTDRVVDAPAPIGDPIPIGHYPDPGECVPAVFTYGTLKPGQSRWALVSEHLTAPPEAAHVLGDLRDTGHGFPALTASGRPEGSRHAAGARAGVNAGTAGTP